MTKHASFISSLGIAGLLVLASGGRLFAGVPPEVTCADLKARRPRLRCPRGSSARRRPCSPRPASTRNACRRPSRSCGRVSPRPTPRGACPGDADAALTAAGTCATSLAAAVSGEPHCAAVKLKAAGIEAAAKAACAGKPADKGSAALAACVEKVDEVRADGREGGQEGPLHGDGPWTWRHWSTRASPRCRPGTATRGAMRPAAACVLPGRPAGRTRSSRTARRSRADAPAWTSRTARSAARPCAA